MCIICHADMKAEPPTMQAFPARFEEGFNMKFSHAAHISGEGRPPEGCASCHETAGPGKSIPVGLAAHQTCYTCHTPESKIGSCNVCHEIAPYRRTPQGVNCSDCHSVRANAPQGSQVSSIAAQEHTGPGNNCASCHNGSRAFGGNDVTNMTTCKRCHTGSGFNMLPGSPF
jgi:hypothetical protein